MTRRFQFSLRALLVAMLVVAAFFGGTRVGEHCEKQRRRQQEDRELAEYGQVGPTVHINYSYPDKPMGGEPRIISKGIIQIAPSDATDWPADWPASIPVSRDAPAK